jgi:hypothetical protein
MTPIGVTILLLTQEKGDKTQQINGMDVMV